MIKKKLNLYFCIFLAILWPSACIKFINKNDTNQQNLIKSIKDFRVTYLEAFSVTIICLFLGYLLAGLPMQISWNKVIPTFLIAFPVYEARFVGMTWGGNSIQEEMDRAFLKAIYVIGITWLAWDIFKGII